MGNLPFFENEKIRRESYGTGAHSRMSWSSSFIFFLWSGSFDACVDRAKVASIDRRRSPTDPLQDIFVGDLRVAQGTRMSWPLYESNANVAAM